MLYYAPWGLIKFRALWSGVGGGGGLFKILWNNTVSMEFEMLRSFNSNYELLRYIMNTIVITVGLLF